QAKKAGRQKSFEDLAAVAADLITRGITTPEQLGAVGSSNGGLLMGVMLTRYPHLFRAIACQAAPLNMKRYSQLLVGAAWEAEYGDGPYIDEYDPYGNVPTDVILPSVLLTTNTRDTRVHPGHTREMAAKLWELGHEAWFHEQETGGHADAPPVVVYSFF